MANQNERRAEIHRIISKHLLDDFRRFQTEYELSNAQLLQWYRSEQESLNKKYQARDNALKSLFHSMINDYSNQFPDELRSVEEQLETAIQSESDVTVFSNLFQIAFSPMKRKIEEVFVQRFRSAAKVIIEARFIAEPTVEKQSTKPPDATVPAVPPAPTANNQTEREEESTNGDQNAKPTEVAGLPIPLTMSSLTPTEKNQTDEEEEITKKDQNATPLDVAAPTVQAAPVPLPLTKNSQTEREEKSIKEDQNARPPEAAGLVVPPAPIPFPVAKNNQTERNEKSTKKDQNAKPSTVGKPAVRPAPAKNNQIKNENSTQKDTMAQKTRTFISRRMAKIQRGLALSETGELLEWFFSKHCLPEPFRRTVSYFYSIIAPYHGVCIC